MICIRAGKRLSVMPFQLTFQGYRLCDGVKKGLQNKIIINPACCVLRLTSLSGYISILSHSIRVLPRQMCERAWKCI